MEATIETLITVFGFDIELATHAVSSISDPTDVQLAWNWILDHGGEDRGGPVIPTQICSHLIQESLISLSKLDEVYPGQIEKNGNTENNDNGTCSEGCSSDENWLCLTCGGIRCGRYAHRHNLSHWKDTGHKIALSLRDLSVWCYECDKYVKSSLLDKILQHAQNLKHPSGKIVSMSEPQGSERICCVSFDPFTDKHRPSMNIPPIGRLENPERTKSIIDHCSECNLLYRCHSLPSTPVPMEELAQTHSLDYLAALQSGSLPQIDIYHTDSSFEAAVRAAGSSISVCHYILSGKAHNGFALTRPPGHHARRSSTSGFCLLNNIAITINHIMNSSEFPDVQRILVFDWDIHHGDGIQEIFYNNKNVLYISIHRHEHQPGIFYDSNGNMDACGVGEGLGFNVNIPLPYREEGYDDIDYDYLLQEIVVPISKQFDPEFVIIAAGFDACENDPVGGNRITPEWFSRTTTLFQSSLISSSHHGRVMLVLEGGYNSFQISRSAESCLKSLLDQDQESAPCWPHLEIGEMRGDIKQLVEEIKEFQRPYWQL